MVASSSRELVGGVGGKPVSVPFEALGEATGVRSWLLGFEEASSSAGEVSILKGSMAGIIPRSSWSCRGSGLCDLKWAEG